MKTKEQNQRCEEFLSCLGNGKTIYECEAENDIIDEEMEKETEEKLIEEETKKDMNMTREDLLYDI